MKKLLGLVVVLFLGNMLMAAPSLAITEPPVTDVFNYTGPMLDPDAFQGQWFKDINSGDEVYRTNEFYDNVEGNGGGAQSCNAIFGRVVNLVYGAGSNIMSFDIEATIINDVPATTDWPDGSNSHSEFLSTTEQYDGTLYDTKLAIEFAINQFGMLPPTWTGPYRNRQPYIQALNEDEEGWYCWTPDNPDPNLQNDPSGDYYVPTWDFGNIPKGASVTRILQFTCLGGGIPPADSRYNPIVNSFNQGDDILLNRSTSLKISNWIDEVYTDNCMINPDEVLLGSDCSVFHNTEPPTPVELSSFTASFSTDGPILFWVTQTETGNAGWNVYRAETNDFNQAIQINNSLIQGAGTTFEPTEYTYVDEYAVQVSNTYYYWLESRDVSGMTRRYGSISLTIPENNGENPEPPDTDLMNLCNYPNPFYPRTEISFELKEPTHVNLSIFNAKGQKIATLLNQYVADVSAPIKINWDGTDNKGNELPSGIYLYRLSAGKNVYINKMIISK